MASVGYLDHDGVSGPTVARLQEPMSNLHWKAPNRPLKSINQLRLKLVLQNGISTTAGAKNTANIVKQNDQFYHSMIVQSHNNTLPYVQLFFVKARSIDEYRTVTRPLIRRWLQDHVASKVIEVEWLIVLVGESAAPTTLTSRTTLFDKIRADFGTDDATRCVRVHDTARDAHTAAQDHAVLVAALKEKVLASFSKRLQLYESQLQLLDERPVANPYFKLILKNYIVKTYHDMTLSEDSLQQCDELMAVVRELQHENTLEFAPGLGGLDLSGFSENAAFGTDIDFDSLVLERRFASLQLHCYCFRHVARCLLELAISDDTLTFSTLHVVDLLRRVKVFVTSLSVLWDHCRGDDALRLCEFQYVMIGEFLSDPYVLETIERNTHTDDNGNLQDVMEFVGELKLTQRDKIASLAADSGLHIKGPLADVPLGADRSGGYTVQCAPLADVLSSQAAFEEEYLATTEAVIDGFNMAGIRPRTIDNLSTEIALIYYHRQDYAHAKRILKDFFRYYQSQGWTSIGSHILKIYIDCLEHTDDSSEQELLASYVDMLSTKACSERHASDICAKAYGLSRDNSLVYPLASLFDIDIDTDCRWEGSKSNTYCIALHLTNTTNGTFKTDRIVAKAVDDHATEHRFECTDSTVEKGKNTFKLATNHFRDGSFRLHELEISINDLVLRADLSTLDRSVTSHVALAEGGTNLSADLSIPEHRRLNDDYMRLTVANASSGIQDVVVTLTSANPHLSLNSTKDVRLGADGADGVLEAHPVSVSKREDGQLVVSLGGAVAPHEVLELLVPYNSTAKTLDNKIMSIEYRISYQQHQETFSYERTEDFDVTLPIAVTVQDIFRSSTLFTNFSVGSSDGRNPIRVIEVDLVPYDSTRHNYKVEAPAMVPGDLVAFGGQPVKFFYKIEKLGEEFDDDAMMLTVRYREVKEECLLLLKRELKRALDAQGQASKYATICGHLPRNLNFKIPLYCAESVLKLEEFDVRAHFAGSAGHFDGLEQVFGTFFQGTKVSRGEMDHLDRTLEIDAPMPLIPYIHEVDLAFERAPNYIVGNPISTTLLLKSTTSWSGKPPLSDAAELEHPVPVAVASLRPPTPILSRRNSPGLEPTSTFANGGDGKYWENRSASETSTSTIDLNLEDLKAKQKKKKTVSFESKKHGKTFQVEIQTFDDWLISGHKKFIFELEPNGTHHFELAPTEIVLIPLKVGRIPLPKIDVKLVENGELSTDSSVSEIDYKNSSETLVVVSELDRVTFEP